MGRYIVKIDGVGNHGCQRELKDGAVVEGCGQSGCVDCAVRACVTRLRAEGSSLSDATLTHWPDGPRTIVDDLLTKKRSGSF